MIRPIKQVDEPCYFCAGRGTIDLMDGDGQEGTVSCEDCGGTGRQTREE